MINEEEVEDEVSPIDSNHHSSCLPVLGVIMFSIPGGGKPDKSRRGKGAKSISDLHILRQMSNRNY